MYHSDTEHSAGLLQTSDQPNAETSIWKYTTSSRRRSLCPQWNSKPQSPQTCGRRPRSHRDRQVTYILILFGDEKTS